MKIYLLILSFLICPFFTSTSWAQNNRIHDNNSIAWYAFFGTFKLDEKWSLHGEFQWRRENFLSLPQQNVIRTGVNYAIHKQAVIRLGYLFADTYPYGDIPIQGTGRLFPEHRTYQMLTVTNPVGRFDISHRFMLEQRWVGRFLDANAPKADDYSYMNRVRYMLRIQVPLKGNTLDNNEPYFAAYDEVMVGFGKNVNHNIFDQNRIGLLGGYKFNNVLKIEGGYIQQYLQFGRLVNGMNVFQRNSGLIINTYITL